MMGKSDRSHPSACASRSSRCAIPSSSSPPPTRSRENGAKGLRANETPARQKHSWAWCAGLLSTKHIAHHRPEYATLGPMHIAHHTPNPFVSSYSNLGQKRFSVTSERTLASKIFLGLSSNAAGIQTHTINTSFTLYTNKPTTIPRQRTHLRGTQRSPDFKCGGHVT